MKAIFAVVFGVLIISLLLSAGCVQQNNQNETPTVVDPVAGIWYSEKSYYDSSYSEYLYSKYEIFNNGSGIKKKYDYNDSLRNHNEIKWSIVDGMYCFDEQGSKNYYTLINNELKNQNGISLIKTKTVAPVVGTWESATSIYDSDIDPGSVAGWNMMDSVFYLKLILSEDGTGSAFWEHANKDILINAFPNLKEAIDEYISYQCLISWKYLGKNKYSVEFSGVKSGSVMELTYKDDKLVSNDGIKFIRSTDSEVLTASTSNGILEIKTIPSGAVVKIDDEYMGTSPLTIELPPYIHHKLSLEYGVNQWSDVVSVEPSKTKTIEFKF